ncbi:hypothetical protein AOT82_1559 [Psychrobacter sp. AntiMn-1]|nr:hypothetical protein AOT82_1559 [Psychrobacter sp. AntiMn-1]
MLSRLTGMSFLVCCVYADRGCEKFMPVAPVIFLNCLYLYRFNKNHPD